MRRSMAAASSTSVRQRSRMSAAPCGSSRSRSRLTARKNGSRPRNCWMVSCSSPATRSRSRSWAAATWAGTRRNSSMCRAACRKSVACCPTNSATATSRSLKIASSQRRPRPSTPNGAPSTASGTTTSIRPVPASGDSQPGTLDGRFERTARSGKSSLPGGASRRGRLATSPALPASVKPESSHSQSAARSNAISSTSVWVSTAGKAWTSDRPMTRRPKTRAAS